MSEFSAGQWQPKQTLTQKMYFTADSPLATFRGDQASFTFRAANATRSTCTIDRCIADASELAEFSRSCCFDATVQRPARCPKSPLSRRRGRRAMHAAIPSQSLSTRARMPTLLT